MHNVWRIDRRVVCAACCLSVCVACGRAPSRDAIRAAVSNDVQRRVPVAIGGTFLGERDIAVDDVRVLQVGAEQGEPDERYWPVRVHVEGRYVALFDDSPGKFAGETEYVLRKNAYGEWVASHSYAKH